MRQIILNSNRLICTGTLAFLAADTTNFASFHNILAPTVRIALHMHARLLWNQFDQMLRTCADTFAARNTF